MAIRETDAGLLEEVIDIRFPTKVTKGGTSLSVAALVVVGDGKGRVGLGYGKARGVPQAIEKANKKASADMLDVQMVGDTIAHEVEGEQNAARVMLKPARPGTGVKAGATVRAVLEVLGVRNILTKVYGSTNAVNVAKATMNALRSLRSAEEVSRLRGVEINLRHPQTEKKKPEAETHAEAPETEETEGSTGAEEPTPQQAEESAEEQEQQDETAPEPGEGD